MLYSIFITLVTLSAFIIGVSMARGYVLTPPEVKEKRRLEKQKRKALKASKKQSNSTNMYDYRGHKEWGNHSSHTTNETPVVVDGKLVAWICSCGDQLPPQIFCDMDGYIVDVSWDPIDWKHNG
jgi:hypothetical protein